MAEARKNRHGPAGCSLLSQWEMGPVGPSAFNATKLEREIRFVSQDRELAAVRDEATDLLILGLSVPQSVCQLFMSSPTTGPERCIFAV